MNNKSIEQMLEQLPEGALQKMLVMSLAAEMDPDMYYSSKDLQKLISETKKAKYPLNGIEAIKQEGIKDQIFEKKNGKVCLSTNGILIGSEYKKMLKGDK